MTRYGFSQDDLDIAAISPASREVDLLAGLAKSGAAFAFPWGGLISTIEAQSRDACRKICPTQLPFIRALSQLTADIQDQGAPLRGKVIGICHPMLPACQKG